MDNNDCLGLIVSGLDEEQKNVDQNITLCRGSLFNLLGPSFSFKCLLSPALQTHLWRTYNLPILLSGLSSLPIRPANIKALTIFHHKTLRGFLKLSKTCPVPALYFLLGELPVEAHVHINTLLLFHNVWTNPDINVHEMVKYILRMCDSNSTTWSNHIQLLCQKYSLPSPLYLLENETPWSKESWKCHVKTKVIVYYEKKLRAASATNSRMNYLNVQLHGLTGRPHPALSGILTTRDTKKLRHHIKFLAGDFLTAERQAKDQPQLNPACKLCLAPVESPEHVIISCRAMADIRQRIFPELMNAVAIVYPASLILKYQPPSQLAQFVIDCTSFNLHDSYRIPSHVPGLSSIFSISRDWCAAVSNERTRLLREIITTKEKTTKENQQHL